MDKRMITNNNKKLIKFWRWSRYNQSGMLQTT